ncbi:hypothetical protein EHQ16_03130 [Leptospira kanakyensis]|uniref:Uncharacterized protein n=1 Tax=Leptospira kanakyensis TaxID=2484968 RepID=A0A6N4Q5X0_9LEPT|nr:hypothetical protein [Leptospira kanakyensis]TGK47537.1 hypothetical protein EHQ11_16500 [Leptospira kanakyensis]TGK63460.1 hypothetical protein EHQ16_03130 [Leptospira kanakyensis]TGK67063.1 hypothetical protein EHQ18_18365 [Leptospira kanakyensis]
MSKNAKNNKTSKVKKNESAPNKGKNAEDKKSKSKAGSLEEAKETQTTSVEESSNSLASQDVSALSTDRHTRLNQLMRTIRVSSEMLKAAQENIMIALHEINRDQLFLLADCETMQGFVEEHTEFHWWKVSKYLTVAEKLLTSEVNKKVLSGRTETSLVKLVEGMKEDNALFQEGEVHFPDGRILGLSDYEKELQSKQNKETVKLLKEKNTQISNLEKKVDDNQRVNESFDSRIKELQEMLNDQTHETGIPPEVRRAFRERESLSAILTNAVNGIQEFADVLKVAHESELNELEHSSENGKIVNIFLVTIQGIYHSVYDSWQDCLPVTTGKELE